MPTKMFVNLPVANLYTSVDFFTKLGFKFNPQFTDENATCMIVSEENFVMLLTYKFFKTFTTKELVDAKKCTESIIALSAVNRGDVDVLVDKAISLGAKESKKLQGEEWMYGRGFQDLDGHLWEIFWMDESKIEPIE